MGYLLGPHLQYSCGRKQPTGSCPREEKVMDHSCKECGQELTPVYEERFDIDRQVFVWNNNPHNTQNQVTSWAAYGDFLWYKRHNCPPRNVLWEDIDNMMEFFKEKDEESLIFWDDRIWDILRDKIPMSSLQSIHLNMWMKVQSLAA